MIRKMKFACLIAALCVLAALAQAPAAQTAPAADMQMKSVAIRTTPANLLPGAPVAFIYVSSNPNNSSTNEISAYAASA